MFDQEAIDAYNEKQKEEAEKRLEKEQEDKRAKEIADAVKGSSFNTQKVMTGVRGEVVRSGDKVAKSVSDNTQETIKWLKGVVDAVKEVAAKEIDIPETKIPEEVTIKNFPKPVAPPKSVSIDNLKAIEAYFKPLEKAVSELTKKLDKKDFSPNISVSAPEVKVEAPDLSGIEKALQEKPEQEKEFDFTKYHAQDIDNNSDTMQYVGLEAPDGDWCFIENDLESDSMRFLFGSKHYKREWDNHISRSYKTFSEAIDAA